jgi:hypothetical protein
MSTGGSPQPTPTGPPRDFTSDAPVWNPQEKVVSVKSAEEFERLIRARQEWVRTALAGGAFLSLLAVLILLLVSVFSEITVENLDKVAAIIVTPVTGIVGTIIGFYFAERRGGGG